MAESSREWIIASNELVLNKYKAIIGSERWLESKSNEGAFQKYQYLVDLERVGEF